MIKNILKRLYPTTKLLLAVALFVSSFIIPGWFYSYFMIVICGIIAFFYGKVGIYIKRVFFSLFWLLVAIFIIQSIFLPSGEVWIKLGFVSIYKEGFLKAVNLTSKITAFVSVLTMLTLITSAKDFTLSLENQGLNPKISFILMLTLQMIPELQKQSVIIMDSQRSRGVETEGNVFIRFKALIPVFIPLVLSSIANTEERAITLESRGFTSESKRTRLYNIEKSKYDNPVRIFLLFFLIFCIVWRVLWVI